MNNSHKLYPVSREHALYFGFIISIFGKIENQMYTAAAGILGTDLGTAFILLGDMNSRTKQQTLHHLNTTIGVNGRISGALKDILDRLRKESKLRNWIAHALWVEGRKEGAIKPMLLILRGAEPKELGHHHNEQEYTADDLREAARRIDQIDTDLSEFIDSSGLRDRVQESIDKTKS